MVGVARSAEHHGSEAVGAYFDAGTAEDAVMHGHAPLVGVDRGIMQRTLGSGVGSRATPALEGMPEVGQDLSIGQVAERTGLSVHTLRFYMSPGRPR
ncbi:MerR family DNA-binding transcriptional regulator [Streptosporangium canum]|uniref:MerR family DNA-binding transcriptional regulator n=1 Tax=Streptosporangium canum TaxID=324952 RepID=UPI00343081CF